MKRYSLTQLARAYLVLRQKTSLSHALRALAAALLHQKRTHQADLVVREIHRQLLPTGEAVVDIETAHALPAALQGSLEKIIAQLTGAKTVTAQYTIHPELIGGFHASTPTHEIKASVAGFLQQL